MESELPIHYAKALFELIGPKDYELYLSAWDVVNSSLEDPSWRKFLSSYSIEKQEKYLTIDKVYGGLPKPTFLNFLKVVVERNHANILPNIGEAFRSLVNDALGIKEGIIFSATPLQKKEVEAIQDALAKKVGCRVFLKEKVDHTLLGGVKVNLDGKVYDGTLRARLQELHRNLKGGAR